MKKYLSDLLKDIDYEVVSGNPEETVVNDVVYDSRAVTPGSLFICIRGESFDGHRFADDSIRLGAKAILTEYTVTNAAQITQVKTANTRSLLAAISAAFYEEPSKDLSIIGITGTNGKTTTAFVLRDILNNFGVQSGLLGTIGYFMPDGVHPASLTTPESLELQKYFYLLKKEKYKSAVMEVSSHSLSQGRVDNIYFDRAVFTNLTRDHLDYHGSMEEYYKTKKILFDITEKYSKDKYIGVVNNDDEWGRKLSTERILTYGLSENSDIKARDIKFYLNGTSFKIIFPDKDIIEVNSKMLGQPAVYNILAAAACAYTMDVNKECINEAVNKCLAPPGRLENITPDLPYSVIVDYAHTPDALERVLSSLKLLKPSKIITLFGCGGDRDKGKRPLMAEAVERYSDVIIVSSDNPRTEDPEEILNDIEKGFKQSKKINRISDRKKAIQYGLGLIEEKDIFLIAGKGHEDYQIIGKDKTHFSDKEIVREHFGDTPQ